MKHKTGKLLQCIQGFHYQRDPSSKMVYVRARTEVFETDPVTRGKYSKYWAESDNHDND